MRLFLFLLAFGTTIISCHKKATCNDGICNGHETGTDCGGPCVACPGFNSSNSWSFDYDFTGLYADLDEKLFGTWWLDSTHSLALDTMYIKSNPELYRIDLTNTYTDSANEIYYSLGRIAYTNYPDTNTWGISVINTQAYFTQYLGSSFVHYGLSSSVLSADSLQNIALLKNGVSDNLTHYYSRH